MSTLQIEKILNVVGPGRILYVGENSNSIISEFLNRGVDAHTISKNAFNQKNIISDFENDRGLRDIFLRGKGSFPLSIDSVIIDIKLFLTQPIETLLKNIYALNPSTLVIWKHDISLKKSHLPYNGKKELFENDIIKAGFRRHPRGMKLTDYFAANDPHIPDLLFFERVSKQNLKNWPLSRLLEKRDLHMDMLRESSPRADAHIIRYAIAAEWVRPGDTVLDCACGLGYGTYILAGCSLGSQFIGVDIDEKGINYANDNYGVDGYIRFINSSATDISDIPDHSIDIVISFETIEHLENYETFLAESARLLKPDGRFIASVPNLWMNEEGIDPNPHHHHVFDFDKLVDLVSRWYIPEVRYAQDAPGGVKRFEAERVLKKIPFNESTPDTEWWIIVASNNPEKKTGINYDHPEFGHILPLEGYVLTDFAAFYDNPWIYRPLIQMGERISDQDQLARLAKNILEGSNPASPDFGAALTVIGYQALSKIDLETFNQLLKKIDQYILVENQNPHTIRWQISTAFVAGRISMQQGNHSQAINYFNKVIHTDACRFSPLLMTKTVAACFWKGVIKLVSGDEKKAKTAFLAGTANARKALHFSHLNAIGHNETPLSFGFSELAEVSDMASQCAAALTYLPIYNNNPGMFWEKINIKRFGLATWALNLSNENDKLRDQVAALANKNDVPDRTKLGEPKNQELLDVLGILADIQNYVDDNNISIHRQIAALYLRLGQIELYLEKISSCILKVSDETVANLLVNDLSSVLPKIKNNDLLSSLKKSRLTMALKMNRHVARTTFLTCLHNLLNVVSREHTDDEKNGLLFSVDFLALVQNDIVSFLEITIANESDIKFKRFLMAYYDNYTSNKDSIFNSQ